MMVDGKKSVAETIGLRCVRPSWRTRRTGQDPIARCSIEALENVMPAVEVRSRRVGGATYQVPVEVRRRPPPGAGDPLAHGRGRQAARNENTMVDRLSGELLDAANNRGTAVKKREGHPPDGRGKQAHSRTIAGKARATEGSKTMARTKRHFRIATEISASWPTSMPARPRRLSGSFTTPAAAYKIGEVHDGNCDHGLDGAGAGTRHHDYVCRDHVLLERQARKHHRHPRSRGFHNRG